MQLHVRCPYAVRFEFERVVERIRFAGPLSRSGRSGMASMDNVQFTAVLLSAAKRSVISVAAMAWLRPNICGTVRNINENKNACGNELLNPCIIYLRLSSCRLYANSIIGRKMCARIPVPQPNATKGKKTPFILCGRFSPLSRCNAEQTYLIMCHCCSCE